MNDQSGRKDRISANAGRIYAALVRCSPMTVAEDTVGAAQAAVAGARHIEEALTDLLTPDDQA